MMYTRIAIARAKWMSDKTSPSAVGARLPAARHQLLGGTVTVECGLGFVVTLAAPSESQLSTAWRSALSEGKGAAVMEPRSDDRDFIHQEAFSPLKTDADVTEEPGLASPDT